MLIKQADLLQILNDLHSRKQAKLRVTDSCSEDKIWTATGFHYRTRRHNQNYAV